MRHLRITLLCCGAAALAALATATPVRAHHAFASEFDAAQPINLRGTVTRVEWINPHTWIHIDVKDASGKTDRVDDRGRDAEHAAAPRRRQEFAARRH